MLSWASRGINSKIGRLCTKARLLVIQQSSEPLAGKMAAIIVVCGCREAHPSALTLNNVAKRIKSQFLNEVHRFPYPHGYVQSYPATPDQLSEEVYN